MIALNALKTVDVDYLVICQIDIALRTKFRHISPSFTQTTWAKDGYSQTYLSLEGAAATGFLR